MRECNILLLQEHWLLDSQLDKLRLNINNVNVHAISGMEANELLVGRPYGGLAILWKCDLQCHIEPIYTKSKRLCAVMLKSAGLEVAIFNVYMPTENNLSTDVYESTLCEISSICEQLDTPFFIQGGDYNVDFQRQQSKHTRVLKNFIEKESLICGLDVNRQLSEMDNKVEYTYESKVNNSFTLIDHMIMSHNLAEHMTLYKALHEVENTSDHSPLVAEWNIPLNVILGNNVNVKMENFLKWHKATPDDINHYKCVLDTLLQDIQVPWEALQCDQVKCDKHDESIEKFYRDILSACCEASACTIPGERTNRPPKTIPGWNSYVEPFHQQALFWHRLWKEAGSPGQGIIADIRRHSRSKYDSAIKHVKDNMEAFKCKALAEKT